jgi:two-component sensor histidine kinase/CHASE3 domain sensor protein
MRTANYFILADLNGFRGVALTEVLVSLGFHRGLFYAHANFQSSGGQSYHRFFDGRPPLTRRDHSNDCLAWRKGSDLHRRRKQCSNDPCRSVELRAALQSAESSQRGYLVGGNEIYLAPFDSAKRQAIIYLEQLVLLLSAPPSNPRLIQRLSQLVTEKIDEMDRTISFKRELRDQEALSLFARNKGKALMDEANVFLSSVIRNTDERLTAGLAEQRLNATWLRWVSIIGGVVIFMVVSAAILTIYRYTREVAESRDQVELLNATLEQRVKDRTADLAQARDKAEVLLAEVNHRVANSLAMVSSLVSLQSKGIEDKVAQEALKETRGRIDAIASVHKRLYSSGDARFVDFNEYLSSLLNNVEAAMRDEGHGASIRYQIDALRLKPDMSVNLGVIVTELVTNSFKYAYPNRPGEIRVRLKRLSANQAELIVEDDGVGRGTHQAPKGTGLGTRIVNAMARAIGADVEYFVRHPGYGARLAFPCPADLV